jgi:hypothetical protein
MTASHNIKKGPCLVNKIRAGYGPETRADIALQQGDACGVSTRLLMNE